MNTRPDCDQDHTTIETPYCPKCGRKKRETAESTLIKWLHERLESARIRAKNTEGTPKHAAAKKAFERWASWHQLISYWRAKADSK